MLKRKINKFPAIKKNNSEYKYDDYDDENENKENVSNINMKKEEKREPLKSLKLSVMEEPKQKSIPYEDVVDDGYETDETVPEELYVSSPKPQEKSAYQRYLEMTDINTRNIPDEYDTDETVILDEEDKLLGGKKRKTIKHTKNTKRTKKRLYKNGNKKTLARRKNKNIKSKSRKQKGGKRRK